MNSNFTRQLIMMSRTVFKVIFFNCCLAGTLMASNLNGQTKSIEEIVISLKVKEKALTDVLHRIESKTTFHFSYYIDDLIGEKITLDARNQSLANVLRDIARQTRLGFKRINQNIHVVGRKDDNRLVEEFQTQWPNNRIVTGRVTSENGEALPGVNILIKGTTIGVVTDVEGRYKINVPEDATILVFSYVGYITEEVDIAGRTTVDFILTPDIETLSEIVVVGYGTQKKSDLTGAVASVTSEEVKALTISNPTLSLQGRVAGVNVQSNGGAPGAGVSVVIRGAGTINGSLDPLYVVDGVFLESLSSVNPNDIQSMEVLKDASAAAIYGSRAANGVVIVTTSKGSDGGLVINAHATVGVSNPTNEIDFLNARQYADVRNAIDDASNAPRAPVNSTAFDPNVDTDWQDLSIRTGVIQDYGFSLSGAGSNSSVYFSANYFNERGVLISSDFNRINLRLNSEYWSTNKKFRLSQSLGLVQKNLNENDNYGVAGYNFPTLPFKDDEGNFVAPSNADHGVAFSQNRYARAVTLDDDNRIDEIFGNIAGELEFLPGLKYRLNLGVNFSSEVDYLFVPTFFWSVSNQGANQNLDADLTESRTTRFDGLIDNILSYNQEIGKHSINAILGSSLQKIVTRGTSVTASTFPSNDLRVVSAAEEVTLFSGDEIVTGLASVYGRLIYDYDDKYLLTATLRRDESSRFAESFRTGYFPSVSAGWRISSEDFFPAGSFLTDLKLRVSYGELGSQNVEDYAFTPVINLNSNYDFGDQRFFGVSRTQFRLQNLVWEKSRTTNFGINAGFLGGKLQATIDYYIRKTDDILLSLAIPQTSGSRQPVVTNAAAIDNKGLEINLNYKESEGAFTYDINLNLTSTSNEITSLGALESPISGGIFSSEALRGTRADVGEQLGVFWGFETAGLYQSQTEIDNDPNLSSNPAAKSLLKPGDLIYVDQNGDGFVNNDDKVNIGNPYPDFEYGLNFNGSYKNFELTLFIQGQVGNEILNANKYNLSFESRSNYSTDVLNAWSETNTNSNFPVVGTTRFDVSDFYIEDGSYLRLKQLRVAYNIRNLFKGSTEAKAFISGQNLLTLTGYSGYDPELGVPGNSGRPSAGGPALLTRGVDLSAYPQSVVIMGGVQFTIK